MNFSNAAKYPVFKELYGIFETLDESTDPIDLANYGFCLGVNKNDVQCGNRPGKQNDPLGNGRVLEEVLSSLKAMSHCDDKAVYSEMRIFVSKTHCHHHYGAGLAKLQTWSVVRESLSLVSETSSPGIRGKDFDNPLSDSLAGDATRFKSTVAVTSDDVFGPDPKEEANVATKMSKLHLTEVVEEVEAQVDVGNAHVKASTTIQAVQTSTTVQAVQASSTVQALPLGIISLKRVGSLRNPASVYNKIYAHPSPAMMAEGVLYIFQHLKDPSIFKIGCSKRGAAKRHSETENCYGRDTRIIYESNPMIPGAPHAESIAHLILQHQRIHIKECFQCGKGHREWFQTSKEEVEEAVRTAEALMRLPGYVLDNGEWKLSPEGHKEMIKMCSFSVPKMNELFHDATNGRGKMLPTVVSEVAIEETSESDTSTADTSLRFNTSRSSSQAAQTDQASFLSTTTPNSLDESLLVGSDGEEQQSPTAWKKGRRHLPRKFGSAAANATQAMKKTFSWAKRV